MRHLKLRMTKALAASCATLCLCGTLEAHSVRIFGAQDGERIVGKAYFVGGGAAEDVDVIVAGQDGTKIATLKTNAKGEFSFSPGAKEGEFKLSVDTGDGHFAKTSVAYGAAAGRRAEASAPAAETQQPLRRSHVELEAVEEIVDKLIAKRLLPLQESIERYEGRTRLRDVLGGLGYILGVAGLASFFVSRRASKPGKPEGRK